MRVVGCAPHRSRCARGLCIGFSVTARKPPRPFRVRVCCYRVYPEDWGGEEAAPLKDADFGE